MAVCTRVKSFFGLSETRRWQILFVSCFSAFFSSLHLFSCLNATGKWSFSKLFSSCATVISLLIDFHISSIVLLFSSLYFFTLSFPLFCFVFLLWLNDLFLNFSFLYIFVLFLVFVLCQRCECVLALFPTTQTLHAATATSTSTILPPSDCSLPICS